MLLKLSILTEQTPICCCEGRRNGKFWSYMSCCALLISFIRSWKCEYDVENGMLLGWWSQDNWVEDSYIFQVSLFGQSCADKWWWMLQQATSAWWILKFIAWNLYHDRSIFYLADFLFGWMHCALSQISDNIMGLESLASFYLILLRRKTLHP